uniref:B30.2/SPRY domain-containing protein n=1 Tax=Cyprinus carpio TaxID=7962 RepID=A0A8C1UBI8_CYPCA
KSCITDCWDQEDQKRVYSCPQCRQTFSPRPALSTNTMLAEVVEKLKKTRLSADCDSGAGDVQCDVCTGRKYKAVKSCLVCLNSYCQNHLEQHESFFRGKRHNLTERSAQTAVEDSERIFTELIRSIERSRSELIRLIRDQEKTAVSRAEEHLERLEQEINDLRRRDAELEQLSHTQHHIQFLQSFQSLSAPPESTDVNDDLFSSLVSSDALRESVHQLRDKLEDFCKEELKKISDRVTLTNIVPRTRKDFLQYSRQLTLDLNTVNKRLRLSKKNRVITYTDTVQSYPDHPDRFDFYLQVLCRESVCGRCYWEIEWSGFVFISVSYKSISRKGGDECLFGRNDQSWSLFCSLFRYSFRHNNIVTVLPLESISSRIGVFVDHSAGTLSFYSVSDTMSLIHTVQTTFTQTLYPGFGFGSGLVLVLNVGSSVKLC